MAIQRLQALPVGAVFALWTLLLLSSTTTAFELPSFLLPPANTNRPVGATAHQANAPYEGLEIPLFGNFIFRPALFKIEACVLAGCLAFLLIHVVGKAQNQSMAKRFADAATPVLAQEFAVVAEDDVSKKSAVFWNGGNSAMMFASGRRGCSSLHVTFDLQPRHDPMELLYLFMKDTLVAATKSSLRDSISLTFTLPATADNINGVFALVNKNALQVTRSGRFDLSFTKVNEQDTAVTSRGLTKQWAIMSETSDLTDGFLGEPDQKGAAQREKVGLVEALRTQADSCLESLVLTDLSAQRPELPIPVEKRQRLLVLTLRVPKNKTEAQQAAELVQVGANIVDALDKGVIKLRSDSLIKLRKVRAQVDKEIHDEATKEDRAAELEAKEEAKRKAEKEKFDKLSPAEQAKRKELERKRAMKKGATKVR